MNGAEKWRAGDHDFGYEDVAGRQVGGPFSEHDTLGRRKLRRLGIADYLLVIARIEPGRVRRVPASAIGQEGADYEGEFAFVCCPCGARPVARGELEKCPGCERHYLHLEPGSVWVTYGEMPVPPLPA